MNRTEGFVPFRGYRTWYRIVGDIEDEGKLPVLLLHGGPGGTHDCLESLEALAETGRRAIFYDQLGCGKSDRADESMWTVETFVDEVAVVRRELGLDRIHLFGSSWGGMLAMEYALTQPAGLESLMIASSPSSIPQWVEETGASSTGTARRRTGRPRQPRSRGDDRRSRIRAGVRGVLPPTRVPRAGVARLRAALLPVSERARRGVPLHERAERVPRGGDT